jgi:regulator of cell morphogenesis and NO signaling
VASLLEPVFSGNPPVAPGEDWKDQTLASLIDHIVRKHHTYCRETCLRIDPLLAKVISKHGENYPALGQIQIIFASLRNELAMHLMKEEQMFFPYIVRLEEAKVSQSAPPGAPFGTVQNPTRMTVQEHDDAGRLIKEIRTWTQNFTPPPAACNSFRALYHGLEEFEADLHQHIHLENNLLFPRSIALEDAAAKQ